MEESFLDWLNSFGHPIGTYIAIIIGGVTLIAGVLAAIRTIKKKYDDHIAEKLLKDTEEREFKKTMQQMVSQVSSIQSDLTDLSNKHDNSISEINSKIDDVWSAVVESQRDSKEGDVVLENQMKSYEEVLDNLNIKLSNMDEKTTMLIDSDKEAIKSFIIDKYYQAKNDGYIELHVLQGLELRFAKYLQENGNTYVGRLMNAIRKMPNDPPSQPRPKTHSHLIK